MERILVVVELNDINLEILETASTVAAAIDFEVIVLVLASEIDDDTLTEELQQWDGFNGVSTDDPAATASRLADYLGKEVVSPLGADYHPIGEKVEYTQPSEKIIAIAKNHDCNHIYITNRNRSPSGKALFGNTAQSVILNFDGFVTVRTA